MTGTRWVLFVIPAEAGIQGPRLSESSESLNLGDISTSGFHVTATARRAEIIFQHGLICVIERPKYAH